MTLGKEVGVWVQPKKRLSSKPRLTQHDGLFSMCMNRKLASETLIADSIMIAITQEEGSWDPVKSYQVGG
jgi:hypothetical protein